MGGWESGGSGYLVHVAAHVTYHYTRDGWVFSLPAGLSFFLVKNRFIEYRYWLSNVLCSMFYAS